MTKDQLQQAINGIVNEALEQAKLRQRSGALGVSMLPADLVDHVLEKKGLHRKGGDIADVIDYVRRAAIEALEGELAARGHRWRRK